jgi:hypothetical protein
MPFLICMDMLTRKAVFYLEIRFQIIDFKFRVFFMLNIYLQFANTLSLNHVILAKSKCHLKIKDKTYLNKAVLV